MRITKLKRGVMADSEKNKIGPETDLVSAASSPLVFISHDARDAALAEAFAKLLKSVSAGMVKTFRSSDRKGTEGIDFGEEWYRRLMTQLQSTSDVVCLFTERSLDRPWILFEAGVAKGKLNTPVIGVALGVPLSRVNAGPFYQFQNMDDSELDLTKLVNQLARRIPDIELDDDVIKTQVSAFKEAEAKLLKMLGSSRPEKKSEVDENAIAKLSEEMKTLPSRIAEYLADGGEAFRRRRTRRVHPIMLEKLMRVSNESDDPVSILMLASVVRDEMPWLHELAMEVYRAVKTGDSRAIQQEIRRFQRLSEMMAMNFAEEFDLHPENRMFAMELQRTLEYILVRTLTRENREPARRGAVNGQSTPDSKNME